MLLSGLSLYLQHRKKDLHDLPTILSSNRLSVLMDSSSIGFSKNGDKVLGFQYEIVKAFADTLGVELVVSQQNDLGVCIEGIKSKDYDIIATLLPNTTDLQKELLFSQPFFNSKQVLVQRIGTPGSTIQPIKRQLELANDTIFIASHSPYKSRLAHLSDEIADTIYVIEIKNKSQEQMVQLVANGSIKQTICDEKLARNLYRKYSNIDVSLPIGFSHPMSWGVSPQSVQLHEQLNSFLKDFIGSSDYWEIYRKYY